MAQPQSHQQKKVLKTKHHVPIKELISVGADQFCLNKPSTSNVHDLAASISGVEPWQPLHKLLRGEDQNEAVGEHNQQNHPLHHIKPYSDIVNPELRKKLWWTFFKNLMLINTFLGVVCGML